MDEKRNLFEELKTAKYPDEIVAIIECLYHDPSLTGLEDVQLLRIVEYAINRLFDLTIDAPVEAAQIITGKVLNWALPKKPDEESMHLWGSVRMNIIRWLRTYDEENELLIREKLLVEVIARLRGAPTANLMWFLAVLGYRSPETIQTIDELIEKETNTKTVDAAISTRCLLGGMNPEEKNYWRELSENTLTQRMTIPLLNALRYLRMPESINFLVKLLSNTDTPGQINIEADIALATIAFLAEVDDSQNHADYTWSCIEKITIENKVQFKPSSIIFWSDLIKTVNSTNVTRFLLKSLKEYSYEGTYHARHIIHIRLAEIVKPSQIEGLVTDDPDLKEILRKDACHDTKIIGRDMTSESWNKLSAWDVALRLGIPETLTWFKAALNETNPFIRANILEYMASFSIKNIPNEIKSLVIEKYVWQGGNDFDGVYRDAAVKLISSCASFEAAQGLLNLGFTFKGSPLMTAINGLNSVVLELCLFKGADIVHSIMELLFRGLSLDEADMLPTNEFKIKRIQASAAISTLANAGILPNERIKDVMNAFREFDLEIDIFALANLADVLAEIDSVYLDTKCWERLWHIAYHENHWVKIRGINALAAHHQLSKKEEFLKDRYDITIKGDSWYVAYPENISGVGGYIAWLLFKESPEASLKLIESLLRNGSWESSTNILNGLIEYSEHNDIPLTFLDILLDRAKRIQSLSYAETALFHYLSSLAPDRFLAEPWFDSLDVWAKDSRYALTQAFLNINMDTKNIPIEVHKTLILLGRDASEEVRKNAYRAMTLIIPDVFIEWVTGLSKSKLYRERLLCVEAITYLPLEEGGRKQFNILQNELMNDCEGPVRDAAWDSLKKRKTRTSSRIYFEKILAIRRTDNEGILNTWKYGDAFAEIAGTEGLEWFDKEVVFENLRPNEKFWLKRIRKNLEKKIKEQSLKRQESWIPSKADVIRDSGELVMSSGERISTDIVIWRLRQAKVDEPKEWGGVCTIIEEKLFLDICKVVEIHLSGGQGGEILATRNSGNLIYFSGSGTLSDAS